MENNFFEDEDQKIEMAETFKANEFEEEVDDLDFNVNILMDCIAKIADLVKEDTLVFSGDIRQIILFHTKQIKT